MQLFDEIIASPASFIDLLRDRPEDIALRLEDLDPSARFPLLRSSVISTAIIDQAGKRLHSTGAFGVTGAAQPDSDCVRRARTDPTRMTLGRGLDERGETVSFVAYASAPVAMGWLLPPQQKSILAQHATSVLAVSASVTSAESDLFAASYSYGLTDLQARVIVAVVWTGSVRAAAQTVGVSYSTAREAVAMALKVSGAGRLPALIEMITVLATGIFPKEASNGDFVLEATGLTRRQLALASCLSSGLTRTEAARAVGVSPAVAKKEIDQVHSLLGTRSAAALARRLNEIKALAMLTDVSLGQIALDDDVLVPTTFLSRSDGTRIAYSDYGPRSGKPVLVLHSSSTTRPVASSLVRALQARNFRVLSVDRPGFGLTDLPLAEPATARTVFEAAARDVSLLCRHLKLKRIDLVCRGAAQVAVALHDSFPSLLGRVVLVNPDPPHQGASGQSSPTDVLKEAFFRRPGLIAALARMLAASLSPHKVQAAMLRTFARCDADIRATRDARQFADYYRSVRPFGTGRIEGYVLEQTAIVSDTAGPPLSGAAQWTLLLGMKDSLHAVDRTREFWTQKVPEARCDVVADAGRLLSMTHPERILAALVHEAGGP
ncbi:MAG: alpha/beta fold hydrolase [Caulobacter sp.]|nr:alpha/beta fold hydrolase [Caulobacter sp.]